MNIKVSLLAVLLFALTSTYAQKPEAWKTGSYTDKANRTHQGWIWYGFSQSPKFKFKTTPEAKEVKIKATDVKGFVMEKDSFVVLNNFKIDARDAASSNVPVDFVQVVEPGFLTLYRHYSSVYSGGDSYSTTHGNPIGAGSSNPVETYIVKKPDSGALLTLYSEPKKMKQQLIEIFENDPVLLFNISQGELSYNDLPRLVKEYNAKYSPNSK